MGLAHIAAAEGYEKSHSNDGETEAKGLVFTRFPIQGLVNTSSADCHITDSAAAGTAMATGKKTNCGRISMSPDGSTPYPTLAELAHQAEMKTGIITNVTLTHATPAVFYAHVPHRRNFLEITRQLAGSNIDFFGGGGISKAKFRHMKKQTDSQPIDFVKEATTNHYAFIDVSAQSNAHSVVADKVIAKVDDLTSDNTLPYEIDRKNGVPSLADITRIGIEHISNKNGFFMMVEGGKIDWAAHDNDAATMIHEVMAFNEAVMQALRFYSKHPQNTLIIVTADHETGGLSLGNGRDDNLHYDLIATQQASYQQLEASFSKLAAKNDELSMVDIAQWLDDHFAEGFTDRLTESDYGMISTALRQYIRARLNPGSNPKNNRYTKDNPVVETIVQLLNHKVGFAWGSTNHTAVPVPLFAIGAGSEAFSGCYENTAIFDKIAEFISR